MTAPLRATDFVASIGVNVHLASVNSSARASQTLSAFDYLGVSLVRSPLTSGMLQQGSVADRLAAAGVRFDVLLGGFRPLADSLGTANAFAASHAEAVRAIEGPNEINNWPITFAGQTGAAAGIAFVGAAATAMKGTALAGVALYDFTGATRSAATMADAATHANIHPYPQAGEQPYDWLRSAITSHAVAGKGLVITETGYTTTMGSPGVEGVDAQTQAKLTLNLLADAASLGAERTFLYDLFDSGAGTAEAGFGLFRADGTAKPAATAIHNLTTILADHGDAAGAPLHDLAYTLSGLPAGARTLLVEKSGGTYELMVWAEPDIWDEKQDRPVAVAAQTVTVSLDGTADLKVYDPLQSASALSSGHGSSVSLALSDHVMVVEISGLAAGARIAAAAAVQAPPMNLSGSSAADTLVGGNGDDLLSGLGGNDTIRGGLGNDKVIGGAGADSMWGGAGADTFVFRTVGDSGPSHETRDIVRDFSAAEGDRIDLSAIDASARNGGNQAFALAGDLFTKVAGQLIQTVSSHDLIVQGDLNGDGRADFAFVLAGVDHPLAAASFIL